eukprot:scaffold35_cov116-Isochrysis_galbana.AAC.4
MWPGESAHHRDDATRSRAISGGPAPRCIFGPTRSRPAPRGAVVASMPAWKLSQLSGAVSCGEGASCALARVAAHGPPAAAGRPRRSGARAGVFDLRRPRMAEARRLPRLLAQGNPPRPPSPRAAEAGAASLAGGAAATRHVRAQRHALRQVAHLALVPLHMAPRVEGGDHLAVTVPLVQLRRAARGQPAPPAGRTRPRVPPRRHRPRTAQPFRLGLPGGLFQGPGRIGQQVQPSPGTLAAGGTRLCRGGHAVARATRGRRRQSAQVSDRRAGGGGRAASLGAVCIRCQLRCPFREWRAPDVAGALWGSTRDGGCPRVGWGAAPGSGGRGEARGTAGQGAGWYTSLASTPLGGRSRGFHGLPGYSRSRLAVARQTGLPPSSSPHFPPPPGAPPRLRASHLRWLLSPAPPNPRTRGACAGALPRRQYQLAPPPRPAVTPRVARSRRR